MQGHTLPIGIDAERITFEAREHVKVGVEDFLERCRRAIGEEHVYPVAPQPAATKCSGEPVSYPEHLGPTSGLTSSRYEQCFRGITRTWPGVTGLVSINAATTSFS